jgi:hypothetical protein
MKNLNFNKDIYRKFFIWITLGPWFTEDPGPQAHDIGSLRIQEQKYLLFYRKQLQLHQSIDSI